MDTRTVDRRASYYKRAAQFIARDPFGYQSRFIIGCHIQAALFKPKRPAVVVPFRRRAC